MVKKISRRLRRIIMTYYIKIISFRLLKKINQEQFYLFKINKIDFYKQYKSIASRIDSDFLHETWGEFSVSLEKDFLPTPKISFFHYKSMLKTMTGDDCYPKYQEFIDKILKVYQEDEMYDLLTEDLIGGVMIIKEFEPASLTSLGRIVHVYQASLCENATNGIKNISTITEWGGGFGGLARVLKKVNSNLTYNIIDIPIVCTIQWLYLSSVLGNDAVNLVASISDGIVPGKINIIPIGFVKEMRNELSCDLFVSAWALSESNIDAQKYIDHVNMFNATHGVLIHQHLSNRHPYAENLKAILIKKDIKYCTENVPVWNTERVLYW